MGKHLVDADSPAADILHISIFILRRLFSCHQVIQNCSQAVNIRSSVNGLPERMIQLILVITQRLYLFRRRISVGISGHPGSVSIQACRYIKIDQTDISIPASA